MQLRLGFNSQGEKILFDSDEQIHNQFGKNGSGNAVGAQEFGDVLDRTISEAVRDMRTHPQTRVCLTLSDGEKVELRPIG